MYIRERTFSLMTVTALALTVVVALAALVHSLAGTSSAW